MLINKSNLSILFTGFNAAFAEGLGNAPSTYKKISMTATSIGSEEKYAWLGSFAKLREWVGDRVIRNLALHDFTIKNRKFEDTISVEREDIEDDSYGVLKPMFSEMGRSTALHPDELIYSLLGEGFTTECYDGQNFFDTEHPSALNSGDGEITLASNMQAGSAAPWYLIDASRMIKPLIWQERIPYRFTQLTSEEDENVFMQDKYLYGIRARVNAGFGLWQLAFGSKAELTKDNYEAARAAMRALKGENGKPLGIIPTHLIIPTSLEGAGRRIINAQLTTSDGDTPVSVSNEWAGSAELLVSEFLPNA